MSVIFPGTTVGITTDEQGIYSLETRDTVSCVQASMIGYATSTQPVAYGSFNRVDFSLEAVEFGIGDVVITPGENPAFPILEGVRRNRSRNDPDRHDTYHCRTYTKTELDLTNIRPGFRNRRLQRNFGFIFNYMDTSALTGQVYLPAMIAESTAELYRSRSPEFKARGDPRQPVSGVENNVAVAQFTGGMRRRELLRQLHRTVQRPLCQSVVGIRPRLLQLLPRGQLVPRGAQIYKIRFHPKRLATPVLDGEVNIDSASFALESATARMPRGTNVNWVKHLVLESENQRLPDGGWFRARDRISAEFSISEADSSKLTSFLGTREVIYSDPKIGEPIPDEIRRMDNNVVVEEFEPDNTSEEYWEQIRPYRLSDRERQIYRMVDSVKQAPSTATSTPSSTRC